MTHYAEGIHLDPNGLDDASVRELYTRLVGTIVDHSERRYGRSDGAMDPREATVFFAEVVVASGAIIADLLSKEDDRTQRRANVVNFQKLLSKMVEEKVDLRGVGGQA